MNIESKYKLVFFDTETTGAGDADRLCQLSYKSHNQPSSEMFDELYKPSLPIKIGAMAVHHITEKMIADKPSFMESDTYAQAKELIENPETVMVAHNIKFDNAMMVKESIITANSVDTLKIARHLDPEMKIERHNLQYLRYFLGLDEDVTEKIQAHDAKSDVLILEKLFERLFVKVKESGNFDDDKTIEKMMEISSAPTLISKFMFGKHYGKKLSVIAVEDKGYLEWLLKTKRNSDEDEEDWIFTLEHFLNL